MGRPQFRKYVQIGRIATVNYGPDYGKIVAIVDVIDINKALVCGADGALSNVARQSYPLRRLTMTNLKVAVTRQIRKKGLKKAVGDADIVAKFENSGFFKKNSKRNR